MRTPAPSVCFGEPCQLPRRLGASSSGEVAAEESPVIASSLDRRVEKQHVQPSRAPGGRGGVGGRAAGAGPDGRPPAGAEEAHGESAARRPPR